MKHRPPFNPTAYRAPLIVVGNLTVGGNGKTPLVAALVRHLQNEGWNPGIICRGDGGRMTTRPTSVVLASQEYAKLGDEARLLATLGVPVWQGRKRHDVVLALLAHHAEVDVVISDDGLQHTPLHRDIELLVLNADRGFGNGWLIPAGPLREPIERLRTVTALILHRAHPQAPTTLPDLSAFSAFSAFSFSTPPCFNTLLHIDPPQRLGDVFKRSSQDFSTETWDAWATASHTHRRVVALTAIAHPESFFAALRARGLSLRATYAFPDHYRFTKKDFPLCTNIDAILITEKDAVKCATFDHIPLWVIPSRVTVPEGLAVLLHQCLQG